MINQFTNQDSQIRRDARSSKRALCIVRRALIIFCIAHSVLCIESVAQTSSRVNRLGNVEVWGRRPMKEIGVQKTSFDSTALKENISLSMADVLAFNSSVFVKNAGRATLSTVAFRGTSPSHTQVTWNGMRINNPMLGSTDFSTIPAYFIDKASLLHGTSSVSEAGGGLGGAVKLASAADVAPGFNAQYIQGIGSFSTYDEFLRVTYGNDKWKVATRAAYSSSENDYKYTNHDKKLNIYDSDHNIIGKYHPVERNKSGAYKDLNLLQEIYYDTQRGHRFGINAWFVNSNRELPLLTTDYGEEKQFDNRQRERTFRGVVSWDMIRSPWRVAVKGGYVNTWLAYDYKRETAPSVWSEMTRSRSRVQTFYGQADGEWSPAEHWYVTASLGAYQHDVRSTDKSLALSDGTSGLIGYDKGRTELSAVASVKWQPVKRIGLSATLRQEMFGSEVAPLIPAIFFDALVSERGNVMFKASGSKNHKFPSLNDRYFMPGGNPDLKSEEGWTYDAGFSFATGGKKRCPFSVSGSVNWFDSRIDNWILWLPTTKGFFSPRNIKKVHAYGVETALNLAVELWKEWRADVGANYSWTPSVNIGEKISPADQSVGEQLPYVPRHSASAVGHLRWKSWAFVYKWNYYSRRFTMSSSDNTLTGNLPAYFMSDIALEKGFEFKVLDLQLKLAVNNLFNEDYISVLSRPMPGINFEFFVGITPKFGKGKGKR